VVLQHASMSADALAALLRGLHPPVIGRIHEGGVLLDLRTVDPAADHATVEILRAAFQAKEQDGRVSDGALE
jgi:L-seryl-tRNA(Ser) seleniumtransferase